ncbi:MAG: protein YrbN [Enterobacteriaceae bacterium]|nr:protein YrbN [Enterobacteriaceae bacterium]
MKMTEYFLNKVCRLAAIFSEARTHV